MFEIQIETTGKLNQKDLNDISALDAIETIYNYPEDIVVFKFGALTFSAFLSIDISDSWFDILGLMRNLENDKTNFDLQFPSQTFWHYWTFKTVDQDYWEIEAHWSTDNRHKITVAKSILQKEWQTLITKVESDLKKQHYQLESFREYAN